MANEGNGPLPASVHVQAARPVRFLFCPGRVKTIEELAICLGMMGIGVMGPGGYEALVDMGVDHLFEREQHSQIITPGVGKPLGAQGD